MSAFLIICFMLAACFLFFQHKRVRKHDQILFPFCQLRRDIMRFLYENVFEKPESLSREEYQSVRRLLDALNGAIRNYNKHKTVMFNLREMEQHLRKYRDATNTTFTIPDNPRIRELHKCFGRLLVKAFIAYTPLIRSEVALRLIAYAYRGAKKTGTRKVAEYVVNNAEKVRDDARRYGLIEGSATA